MTNEELEIAKKIAEIEGLHDKILSVIRQQQAAHCNFMASGTSLVTSPHVQSYESIYNPFDWPILGPLTLKYGVSVMHPVSGGFINVSIGRSEDIWCSDKSDVPMAILKCIIKSQE